MDLKGKTAHFTGIGGVGMSGLAELCHGSGLKISGSDLQEGPAVRRLISLGIPVFIGHKASCITKDTGRLIFSSAIDPSNIELKEARKRGIPIVSRSEALAEMMRLKRGIVVAGSHGKTTVTALLGSAFEAAGADPTVTAGGRPAAFESTARLGKGEWFIAESDESDGSFHHLRPEIAVLTNIDDDHVDFYGSFAKLKRSFAEFLEKIPPGGALIACGDDNHVREAVRSLPSRRKIKICFYGLKESNDFVLKRERAGGLRIFHKNNQQAVVLNPPLMGEHNSLNVAAAFLCGREAGLCPENLIQSLNSFKGVARRGELKAVIEGIHFFDDYAHHPTEIRAALKGFREKFPRERLIALFQPHRYSRLSRCWKGFLSAFHQADCVYVSDVWPAGEKPIPGVSGPDFAKVLQKQAAPLRAAALSGLFSIKDFPGERVSAKGLSKDRTERAAGSAANSKRLQVYFTPAAEAPLRIAAALRSGDLFVTLGAGSVYQTGEEIIRQVRRQKKTRRGNRQKIPAEKAGAKKNSRQKTPGREGRRGRGAALMTVLALTAAVGVILQKVWTDSRMEHLSARRALHDLRAKYNAQSGMELSLLRLRIFKEAKQVLIGNKQAAFFKPYLDLIWREPLVWPLPVPAEISEADRQILQKTQADSFLEGGYAAEILPEDGKLNLNLLADPVEYLRTWTALSFVALLQRKEAMSREDSFLILGKVEDWTDRNNERISGGLEDADAGFRNRSFLFLEELRLIPGVTAEIYNLKSPFVTVSAAPGWNVNYAPRELLEAAGLSEDTAAAVLARTTPSSPHYSPFSAKEDFCDFLTEQGDDLCSFFQAQYETNAMLKFDPPSNFLIRGRGFFRNSESRYEALIYDANLSLAAYKKAVEEQEKINRGEEDPASKPGAGPDARDTKLRAQKEARLRALKKKKRKKTKYRSFSPLHIIYWREI